MSPDLLCDFQSRFCTQFVIYVQDISGHTSRRWNFLALLTMINAFWCLLRTTVKLNLLQRKSVQQKCHDKKPRDKYSPRLSPKLRWRSAIRGSKTSIIYSYYYYRKLYKAESVWNMSSFISARRSWSSSVGITSIGLDDLGLNFDRSKGFSCIR